MYRYAVTNGQGLGKRVRQNRQEGTISESYHEVGSGTQVRSTHHEATGIRWELVHRIRKEIAAGTYATPEKLELAMERLLAAID